MAQSDLFACKSSPPKAQRPRRLRGAVIREVTCRTILNRSAISDYSLNCYTGCAHGCVYCYARFMQRFHPHPEPWGKFVDVKTNAVEALERQLRRAKPAAVFLSSACDGWQPIEAERRLTRRCCELLLEHGFRVNVLTKSALALRDMDVFARGAARVGVTITTLDERLRRLWEPKASPVEERLRVIREARRRGIRTAVMFGPLLPFLSDGADALREMFRRAVALGVDVIWTDAMNPRPRVWPSVAGLLQKRFPELRERYRRLLFEREEREVYLAALRERIASAAKAAGAADRLAGCP